MDYFSCPACGSEYFLSSQKVTRTVFKMQADREFEIFDDKGGEEIDTALVCCGACSWRGSITEVQGGSYREVASC